MTFPSKPKHIAEPFTEFKAQHNMKPREVYCKTCKYKVVTDLPGARCSKCQNFLIAISPSGSDELG